LPRKGLKPCGLALGGVTVGNGYLKCTSTHTVLTNTQRTFEFNIVTYDKAIAQAMSVSYASKQLRIPTGFEYLLESLSREVLREQPEDIIAFAAQYFKTKLRIRDGRF